MAETKIEWTHGPNGEIGYTFNPWIGCSKVSPACDHCYAESWDKRFSSTGGHALRWGPKARRTRTSKTNWNLPLKWNQEAARLGVRRRVFCASLADVFDNAVPPEWRCDLIALIAETPHLDWLLLTKRIGNAHQMLIDASKHALGWTAFPNVWIGATICNQEEADRDIPKLLAVPAAKRFLSMEPLLGPVDLTRLSPKLFSAKANALTGIWNWEDGPSKPESPPLDWVIVGGESGPHARPMSPDWVRSLRDQCRAAGVPFFFKQWGEWLPMLGQAGGVVVSKKIVTPDGWSMGWAGKKAAGRRIDGCVWNESPT